MAEPNLMGGGRCTAKSKQRGTQCRQPAIAGGTVCRYHGGAAPQVRQAALERLKAFQDRAIDRLFELAVQEQYPSTSYQAVRDVLDRTMGKPAESVQMNVSGEITTVSARLIAARQRLAAAKKTEGEAA